MKTYFHAVRLLPLKTIIIAALLLPFVIILLVSAFFAFSNTELPRSALGTYIMIALEIAPSIALVAISGFSRMSRVSIILITVVLFKIMAGGLILLHMLIICDLLKHCWLLHI